MLIQQIFDIITEISQQGTTILVVEQNAKQALSRSDRAYVLETGQIVKTGTGAELLDDPSRPRGLPRRRGQIWHLPAHRASTGRVPAWRRESRRTGGHGGADLEEVVESMSRTPVTVRVAADHGRSPALRELWGDILRRGALDEQLADVGRDAWPTADAREDQCVVVAEFDGEVAGAVYLEATTLTPLNLERAVLAVSPHVFTAVPPPGRGQRADGGGLPVRRAARHQPRPDGRGRRGARRQPLHGAAVVHPAGDAAGGHHQPPCGPGCRSRGRRTPAATSRQRIDRVLAARRIRRERVPG